MPPAVRFDAWWRRFERVADREIPPAVASRLLRKIRRVRRSERLGFVQQLWDALLQRRHAYDVALLLLDGLTDPQHLQELASRILPLPVSTTDDEEAHLAELLRVLAAADCIEPVEDYLLRRAIRSPWPSVVWGSWPSHPDLFTRAWCRFVLESPPRAWTAPAVIRPFLAESSAIRRLRATLEQRDAQRWRTLRRALLQQARHVEWLAQESRQAVERAVS